MVHKNTYQMWEILCCQLMVIKKCIQDVVKFLVINLRFSKIVS
jgi:hypothetical protein